VAVPTSAASCRGLRGLLGPLAGLFDARTNIDLEWGLAWMVGKAAPKLDAPPPHPTFDAAAVVAAMRSRSAACAA
jgi:hypothetical protein